MGNRIILVSVHREVDQPCRSKVAEYLAVREEALAPVIGPEFSRRRFAGIDHFLGVINPCLQVRIHNNLAVLNPRSRYVVGINTVCIVDSRSHLVAGCFCLLSCCHEGIPVLDSFLNRFRIIRSKDVFRRLTVVNQTGRACLPGRTLDVSVFILDDILRVIKLIRQICIRDAKICKVHGHIAVDILQSIVSFHQEDIDLVIRRSIRISWQNRVKVVLIGIVITRGDCPLNGDITDLARRIINLLISGVMILHAALELFVPCLNVKDGSLRRS